MENLELTAVFVEAEEGGYVAYIDQMKGVITQGETIGEAEENLYDALQMFLEPDNAQEIMKDQSNVLKKPFMSLRSI